MDHVMLAKDSHCSLLGLQPLQVPRRKILTLLTPIIVNHSCIESRGPACAWLKDGLLNQDHHGIKRGRNDRRAANEWTQSE